MVDCGGNVEVMVDILEVAGICRALWLHVMEYRCLDPAFQSEFGRG